MTKNENFRKFINLGVTSLAISGILVAGLGVSALEWSVGINSDKSVQNILEPYNLHDIKKTSYNLNCFSNPTDLPFTRVNFEAKNAQNEEVEGSICANRNFIKDSIEIKKKFKP